MSAQGIVPDPGYGGIAVDTIPAPVGVTNAYVPPGGFTVSSQLYFYGGNPSANYYDPQQFNGIVSEMLSLAVALAPNGTWNTGNVTNLANAFTIWAESLGGSTLTLAKAVDYPGDIASDVLATTPAYVAAALAEATEPSLALAVSSDYPADVANNSLAATPAYVAAAVAAAEVGGSLATAADFPADVESDTLATTPAYVAAAIAGAGGGGGGGGPSLTDGAAYPSTSDTTAATPLFVNNAVADGVSTAEAAIPALKHSASYPSTSDNTAATPAFVNAAVAGGSGPSLTHGASYPSSSDTTAATPLFVNDAVSAGVSSAISTAEAAIPALAVGGTYPDPTDNTKAATPAYVAAAVAGGGGGALLTVAADYPADDTSDSTAATPAYVAAAVAGGGGASLTIAADYPADDSSDTTAATPAYVAAAIAGGGGGPSLAIFSDYPTDVANDTLATTPKYVAAAIAAGGGATLTHAASYPSTSDSTAATPQFVNDAIAGAGLPADTGPTVVQFGATNGNSTTAAVTLGSGPVNGNMLIAMVWGISGWSANSGWTQIIANGTNTWDCYVLYRIAGASEPALQQPVATGSSQQWGVGIWELNGQNATPSTAIVVAQSQLTTDASNPATTVPLPAKANCIYLAGMVPDPEGDNWDMYWGTEVADANVSSSGQCLPCFGHSGTARSVWLLAAHSPFGAVNAKVAHIIIST